MKLNFKTFGQGEPLLILHGLFGMLDNWQTIGKKLAEDFLVFLVDLRNHGRSPHATEVGYQAMAEDLRLFMESQGIGKSHLIGHSMGGKVAMHLALNHPDSINKLVVVDIGIKRMDRGHDHILNALNSVDLSQVNERKVVELQIQEKIEDPGIVLFLMKNLSRNLAGTYEWKMNLPALTAGYERILEGITALQPFEGKTLFVRGGRSNYILDQDIPAILTLFPNASLHTIAGAGHWVHAEAPEEFYSLVKDFLIK